jgi:hypothetical protein
MASDEPSTLQQADVLRAEDPDARPSPSPGRRVLPGPPREHHVAAPVAFTADDRRRLSQALGPSWNADDVATLLARAGASEILALATGRTVPATLAEARAFRIFNLLQQGMSLSDAEALVAAIFKVPSATAKRMVNSAVARYAVELQQGLSGTIGEVLEAATWDEDRDRWEIRIPPTFIRERILEAAARLPVPDPSRVAGSLWRFPDETYQAVRKEVGLSAKPPR